MRRAPSWRFTAALLVGLSPLAAAWAAEPDEPDAKPDAKPAASQSWFSSWFSPAPKKPDKKPAPHTADGKAAAKLASAGRDSAAERAREQNKWLRRTDVCLKLQAIANQTNDEALWAQAQKLSERASAVYDLRIAHIPTYVSPAMPADGSVDLDKK